MRLLTAILLLCLCVPAVADQKVYKTVGPNGEVIFSDKPSPGAKEMDVPPAPTYKALPLPATPSVDRRPPADRQHAAAYSLVTIVAPADEGTVVNTTGTVKVTVLVQPALKAARGDKIALLLDGKVAAKGTSPNLSIANVDRGTHTLQAEVVGRNGETIVQSSSITFHLHRPSIHLPGRPKPKSNP